MEQLVFSEPKIDRFHSVVGEYSGPHGNTDIDGVVTVSDDNTMALVNKVDDRFTDTATRYRPINDGVARLRLISESHYETILENQLHRIQNITGYGLSETVYNALIPQEHGCVYVQWGSVGIVTGAVGSAICECEQ